MSVKTHVLGYPRIGVQREMKKAVESFWADRIDLEELKEVGKSIRQAMWQDQKNMDFVSVGDFSWYDHILDASMLFGVCPPRFSKFKDPFERMFAMARGYSDSQETVAACEMTKWFNTNYHYLVPELQENQEFSLNAETLLEQVSEAQQYGYQVKVVLPGPLNYLYLSKMSDESEVLDLLPSLLKVYEELISTLAEHQVSWLQLDEPWLVSGKLDPAWQAALIKCYQQLHGRGVNILLTSYFGDLRHQHQIVKQLKIDGLHLDLVEGDYKLEELLAQIQLPLISLGVINGRNIWRSDLHSLCKRLDELKPLFQDREIWLASSCSLLHVPVSLVNEKEGVLDAQVKDWLAFAQEKCGELTLLKEAFLNLAKRDQLLKANQTLLENRRNRESSYNKQVRQRCKSVNLEQIQRLSPYKKRIQKQRQRLQLPLFPTTTIGSLPQTTELRQARRNWRRGLLSDKDYRQTLEQEIRSAVKFQEEIDLDVLVHGEPERNDMVEYFGEQLHGYTFSSNGWVQSYGSRCVKPPIIYGDVYREKAMTIDWITFAQSLTEKPLKGMLTGPVTMLFWSFVRDDLSRKEVCKQIALALLDEVRDLEKAGIKVIQIDEPALREGLPLQRELWQEYLNWAVSCFRLSHYNVDDQTQIHTHMCYSEFNDIMAAIAALDADVITIETSRSHSELFESFKTMRYPNDIGPGVYDIHSPNIPSVEAMQHILTEALNYLDPEQLWVNPDCGLKTRKWQEVESSLKNMVRAAQKLREEVVLPT